MATITIKGDKRIINISKEDIIEAPIEFTTPYKPKPKIVYHYTSINTFEKILQSKALRFTNLRDVNDKSECYYGLNLLLDRVTDYENKRGIELNKRIPQSFFHHFFFTNYLYSVSFTENGDDLVFWNSHYIDKNKAVSIGFETATLENSGFRLNFCIYGDPYPHSLDADTYMMLRHFYLDPEQIPKNLKFIQMTHQSAHIKNESFEPEKEWRAIFLPHMRLEPNIFKRGDKSCRYFDLPFDVRAITKVVVGPAGDNICRNIDMVKEIARKYKIEIDIDYSKIPLEL